MSIKFCPFIRPIAIPVQNPLDPNQQGFNFIGPHGQFFEQSEAKDKMPNECMQDQCALWDETHLECGLKVRK